MEGQSAGAGQRDDPETCQLARCGLVEGIYSGLGLRVWSWNRD